MYLTDVRDDVVHLNLREIYYPKLLSARGFGNISQKVN